VSRETRKIALVIEKYFRRKYTQRYSWTKVRFLFIKRWWLRKNKASADVARKKKLGRYTCARAQKGTAVSIFVNATPMNRMIRFVPRVYSALANASLLSLSRRLYPVCAYHSFFPLFPHVPNQNTFVNPARWRAGTSRRAPVALAVRKSVAKNVLAVT